MMSHWRLSLLQQIMAPKKKKIGSMTTLTFQYMNVESWYHIWYAHSLYMLYFAVAMLSLPSGFLRKFFNLLAPGRF